MGELPQSRHGPHTGSTSSLLWPAQAGHHSNLEDRGALRPDRPATWHQCTQPCTPAARSGAARHSPPGRAAVGHSLAWTCRQQWAQEMSGLVPSSPTYELAGSGSVFSPLEVKHISGISGRVLWPLFEGGWTALSRSVCTACRVTALSSGPRLGGRAALGLSGAGDSGCHQCGGPRRQLTWL